MKITLMASSVIALTGVAATWYFAGIGAALGVLLIVGVVAFLALGFFTSTKQWHRTNGSSK